MQNVKAQTPAKTATKADAKKAPARKPAPKAASKAAAKPAKLTPEQIAAAQAARGLQRDANTIQRGATFFGQYSDRDTAYLAFFGSVMRKHNDAATLAQIHDSGTDAGGNKRRNPFYTGSAKATDAGAINRLIKAGYIKASTDGQTLRALPKALESAAYRGKAKPA